MPDNTLELVVEVDTNRPNAPIRSVNSRLSRAKLRAARNARGATMGIDGMTAAMVKGAAAGNLRGKRPNWPDLSVDVHARQEIRSHHDSNREPFPARRDPGHAPVIPGRR